MVDTASTIKSPRFHSVTRANKTGYASLPAREKEVWKAVLRRGHYPVGRLGAAEAPCPGDKLTAPRGVDARRGSSNIYPPLLARLACHLWCELPGCTR